MEKLNRITEALELVNRLKVSRFTKARLKRAVRHNDSETIDHYYYEVKHNLEVADAVSSLWRLGYRKPKIKR